MRSPVVILISLVVCLIIFLGGGWLGYHYRGLTLSGEASLSSLTHDLGSHDDDHDHDDHVDISIAAAKNLGLQIQPLRLRDYQKTLYIPAVVIEKPGQSGLTVAAPAQGIVRQIFRFPGQALSPGDRLFTLQLTDEALESAQLSILETLTRMTVAERELVRLEPLTQSGAVVGRRKLELEYELKQLASERSARLQELRLRGLSQEQIERVIEARELVGEIDIHLDILAAEDSLSEHELVYTVEQLDAFPGRSVRKGDELCHIANHYELFLRGEAFETDLDAIHQLSQKQWTITAEFGDVESPGRARDIVEGLKITYIDNHVDPQTQTFPFYLVLPNQVVAESSDAAGRVFRSWRFKPGQRAHLQVPIEHWGERLVLPRDAVVRSGVETFVFLLENADELGDLSDLQELGPEELWQRLETLPELEFEPVAVRVLHQDRQHCVIEASDVLQPGQLVAMNQAYQLLLAWRMQLSGGGGHHHDH